MKEIILIGGGGHCKSVIDIIEQEGKFKIAGIVDKLEFLGTKTLGYEVIGCDNDLNNLSNKYKYALVTVGQIQSPQLRIKLFENINNAGFIMPVVISPRAYISKHSNIGKGTLIMHDVLVNADVEIGNNCIINSKSLLEHDSKIGDHCHISTSVVINGGVKVGQGSFIGSGSVSIQGANINENSVIKAGSTIK